MNKTLFVIFIFSLFFFGCASKPGFDGRGDLCGLVIDENNKPVKDFIVYCSATDKGMTPGNYIQPVLTNESGLFIFPSLSSGEYQISGEKNNYLRFEGVTYRFYQRTNILCLQTKSFKTALLKAEELLYLGQKNAALEELEKITCEKNSPQEKIVYFYKFFALETNEERRSLLTEITIDDESTFSDFCNRFAARLEEAIK